MLESFAMGQGKSRFAEPMKLLPVTFICIIIVFLWYTYMVYHCIPLCRDPHSRVKGILQTMVFNFATLMLSICYAKCLWTHPGTIPDGSLADESEWQLVPRDIRNGDSMRKVQETKRSGDRRHCKWCAKSKPDRCHHCRVCRTCVLRMDHHCPWIYNCVGFHNHKFFFLLLFYCDIACHLILWSMFGTVKAAILPEAPFLKVFLLLLGETLAVVFGFVLTLFFGFHVWLMVRGMTTIEFCEKSVKRSGYDSSLYDRGLYGNVRAVLGDNPWLWLCPCSPPSGDGLSFITEEAPLLRMSKDVDRGPGTGKKKGPSRKHNSTGAGTGEHAGLEASSQKGAPCSEGGGHGRAEAADALSVGP